VLFKLSATPAGVVNPRITNEVETEDAAVNCTTFVIARNVVVVPFASLSHIFDTEVDDVELNISR
jgi:hypothetical protein